MRSVGKGYLALRELAHLGATCRFCRSPVKLLRQKRQTQPPTGEPPSEHFKARFCPSGYALGRQRRRVQRHTMLKQSAMGAKAAQGIGKPCVCVFGAGQR